jgi:hypothetical protein
MICDAVKEAVVILILDVDAALSALEFWGEVNV